MKLFKEFSAGAQIARAVRSLGGPATGTVFGYYPVARMNPYQTLLYGCAHREGFAPVGLRRVSDFGSLEVASRLGTRSALHLHWTSAIAGSAIDKSQARSNVADFLKRLTDLKSNGTHLVWTVHNVLPHGCPYPAVEAHLRQRLADLADVIHIMTSATPELVGGHYTLPSSKLIQVEHPSYLGAYPRHFAKEQVRFDMGYEPYHTLVGVVGSIQPYKGLEAFARATAGAAAAQPNLRALVAGIPGTEPETRQLLERLDEQGHIETVARKLSSDEISIVMTALDALVLPYTASLNSGAALLGLTFGIPVIAPRIGHFADLERSGLVFGYDPGDEDSLTRIIGTVPELIQRFDPTQSRSYCESVSGPVISHQFFDSVKRRLETSV